MKIQEKTNRGLDTNIVVCSMRMHFRTRTSLSDTECRTAPPLRSSQFRVQPNPKYLRCRDQELIPSDEVGDESITNHYSAEQRCIYWEDNWAVLLATPPFDTPAAHIG